MAVVRPHLVPPGDESVGEHGQVTGGSRLRVLSVSQLFPGSATATEGLFVHQRLRELPETVDVRVWRTRPWFPFLRSSTRPRRESVDGMSVEDVPFLYVPGMLKGLDGPCLLRALRRRSTEDVDVIDAHFAYPTGWAAVQLGRERGLPVVITLRGTELPYSQDPARRRRLQEAVQGADRIIAVSGSLGHLALELGASPDQVVVVGNGIDADRFGLPSAVERSRARTRYGIAEDATVLLTVGGLTRRKGVQRVIRILASLVEAVPALTYVVAGAGSSEGDERARLEELAREEGVADRVRFLGHVPHDELPSVYHAADAFVLSTSNEGWANALQESIACGLPTVTTDVGGNREVLGDGSVGAIVPFDDEAALRSAVRDALTSVADRESIAAFGRRRTWAHVGKETAAILWDAARTEVRS